MSKELEALEKLYPKTTYMPYYTRSERRLFCKIVEKSLKALEIIKEKEIDIAYIKCCDSREHYNVMCELEKEKLTQEEYDLLKEVLL